MNQLAVHAGGAPATILGESRGHVATGGKIRPGIQVLTKKAASNERVRAMYEQGVKAGLSFEAIEQQIKTAFPDIGTPLVPKNTPYFTVRPGDFPNPAVAQQLLDKYGEDRGDGRKLYRFPVIFPYDHWQLVMPHSLKVWGRSGLKYWAEYSEDGSTRQCMETAPPKKDGDRVIRMFGGLKSQVRKKCNPETCQEYQSRQCNLQGRIIVFVPDVESVRPLEIPTQSFYGMQEIRAVLESVAFMRGGKISGRLDRDKTFFISKTLKSVSHIDPATGQRTRVEHWILQLEAPIDVTKLLRVQDDEAIRLANDAASVLSEGVVLEADEFGSAQGGNGTATAQMRSAEEQGVSAATAATADDAARPLNREEPTQARQAERGAPEPAATQTGQASGPGMAALQDLLRTMRVEFASFEAYANKRWGKGWSKNPMGLNKARSFVESHLDDPESLRPKIENETTEAT